VQLVSDPGLTSTAAVRGDRVLYVSYGDTWELGAGRVMAVPVTGGEPVTVVDRGHDPWRITTDDAALYFTTLGGSVMKVPLAGGEPETLASGGAPASDIAVSAGSVYWVADGVLRRVPVGGGHAEVIAEGLSGPSDLVADGSGVFWRGNGLQSSPPPAEPFELVGGTIFYGGLALDAHHVYVGMDSGIGRASRDGGAVELFVRADPMDVAVDGDRLYWVSVSRVRAAPLAGGLPLAAAEGTDGFAWLAATGGAVFWMELSMSRPPPGTPPFRPPIAPSPLQPRGTLLRLGACEGGRCRR
jgi:hypothetical protein